MPTKSTIISEIPKVTKRDGRIVAFDPKRINRAISKAVAESGEFDAKETKRLTDIAVTIMVKSKNHHIPTVEEVQDVVEQVLMAAGHYKTAKRYILYREERRQVRSVKSIIGVEDDLGLSMNQLKVLERRYLLHDENGQVTETPRQLFTRVANTLAAVELKKQRKLWQEQFFQVMANLEFLPAGRTLNNAGTKQNQLANCFVLPVDDSMEAIFDSVKWTALVHQSGGGTGFNFSKLRPNGDVVTKSAGGFATGPVSFMKVFDIATRQVMQGGKKRGANMGILNVDHPDIMEFIACKTNEGDISNFNISVGATDTFMKAVKRNTTFTLKNQRTGDPIQTLRASTLIDQIATLAWRTGDPGIIFLDTINQNNPLLESFGPIDATNPCGEQPLHPFDACNLGSINLSRFVTKNQKSKKSDQIDWNRLKIVTHIAVRMLDNVIDAGTYPLPQIADTVKANRRIGLGVMGFADLLFKLNIPYNSRQGVKLAEQVMQFIQTESWHASRLLAKEKSPFPRWSQSAFAKGWNPLTKTVDATKKNQLWQVRNVAITTIAPTGTISMVADCSSGIEPAFALSYVKNVVDEAGLSYVNPYFATTLKQHVGTNGEYHRLINQVSQTGSCQHITGITDAIKDVYVTAHDITWQDHIAMQAAFQKYVDNAVSKTINLPHTASIDDIKAAYLMAWESGCKGVTVYRDGSKDFQVLQTARDQSKPHSSVLIQSTMKHKTLKQRSAEMTQSPSASHQTPTCPECGGNTTLGEGCVLCHSCGWSACSA
jgi:ribonucleoside-diphosphate reductase alpha chain